MSFSNNAMAVLLMIIAGMFSGNVYSQSTGYSIRFAGLQMNTTSDVMKNRDHIIEGLKKAAGQKADFLVTPEGSLSGYTDSFNQDEVDRALKDILEAVRQLKVGLFLGTCFKEKDNGWEYCYNQIRVYTPGGEFLGAYSKILRCSPLDHPGTGEMNSYAEGQLRLFPYRGLQIGTLICNDMWATPGYTTIPNPYLAWKLKQMGARIIVHCINSGSDQRYRKFHESSAELWAYSLHVPIIEVNAAQEEKKINAESGLISGEGKREVVAPDTGEQFFIADITLPGNL